MDCELLPLENEDSPELHPAERVKARGFVRDNDGWARVKSVMDSGCNISVAPPTMCPDYEVVPSAGSIRGQHFISASNERTPNVCEQVFKYCYGLW